MWAWVAYPYFALTVGFTFQYISFSILLLYFLLTENINGQLNVVFSKVGVNMISKVGFCSYSIYVIHTLVNYTIEQINYSFSLSYSHYLKFVVSSIISILLGMMMTYGIENYFLKIRDKYYPNRAAKSKEAAVAPVVAQSMSN